MDQAPKTQAEANRLTYGRWVGNPAGRRYNVKYCAYEVREKQRGAMARQCSRKRGHGPDNLYCKSHAKTVCDKPINGPITITYSDKSRNEAGPE